MAFTHPSAAGALVGAALVLVACEQPAVEFDAPVDCTAVRAVGHTTGSTRALAGDATFFFDGVERPALVGVYLDRFHALEDGSAEVNIVYQFTWPNGDLVLTENDVRLTRLLSEEAYHLDADLTIKSGQGMFSGLEGEEPFGLRAELTFAEATSPEGRTTVSEEFEIEGLVCRD